MFTFPDASCELPVDRDKGELLPVLPELCDDRVKDPVFVFAIPLSIFTLPPPLPDEEAEYPAEIFKDPPIIPVVGATDAEMDPPEPPVAGPVKICIFPLLPVEDVPDLIRTFPELPDTPPL
jgi:hypothetical protein